MPTVHWAFIIVNALFLTLSRSGGGSEWNHVLWMYIGLRAVLDVMRASSLMMFEVTPSKGGGCYDSPLANLGGGVEPVRYFITNILNKIWRPNEQKFYEGSGLVTPSRGRGAENRLWWRQKISCSHGGGNFFRASCGKNSPQLFPFYPPPRKN